jgi:capsular polysaccharide transport system permease protein
MSILSLFRLQYRVITALILRELHTRFGRENLGYLWMIGEPMLFSVAVTIMWTAIRPAHEHGVPVTAFVITGYVPLVMWRHCVGRSVKAFEANGSLLFHRQVTPLDIIVARVILEVLGSLMTLILLAGIATLAGFIEAPKDIGLIYVGFLYYAFFSAGSALFIAAATERSESLEKTISIVTYLALPFSGCFTMVDWLTPKFQKVVLYSPMVHASEMIRSGWFGTSVVTHYDYVYVTWTCSVLFLVGLSMTLRSRRYLVVQ